MAVNQSKTNANAPYGNSGKECRKCNGNDSPAKPQLPGKLRCGQLFQIGVCDLSRCAEVCVDCRQIRIGTFFQESCNILMQLRKDHLLCVGGAQKLPPDGSVVLLEGNVLCGHCAASPVIRWIPVVISLYSWISSARRSSPDGSMW